MAAHPQARQSASKPIDGHFDLESFVERFGARLLASARHHSSNAADADDAYQRALEILITKPPEVEHEKQLLAWMHTVVRNEALQTHRRRRHELNTAFDEISEGWLGASEPAEELVLDAAESQLGREAISRVNPDQIRCLLLRADGFAYPEICAHTGFSYAKVNRLISEGRKALRVQAGLIESGAECRRLFPALSATADGEETVTQAADLAPHLENCLACRATLREIRSTPKDLAAAFPLGGLVGAGAGGLFGRFADHCSSIWNSLLERLGVHAGPAAANGSDVVVAKKIITVGALAAALVGGGVAIDRSTGDRGATDARPPAGMSRSPAAISSAEVSAARERARVAARRSSRQADRRAARRSATQSEESVSTRRGGQGSGTVSTAVDPNDIPPREADVESSPQVEGLAP